MAAPEASQDLKTYTGNCHCGAFKYTLNIPELKSAMTCNCSVCTKKGYMWIFPHAEGAFKVVREGELKTYEFGKKGTVHKFCTTCGTAVFAIIKSMSEGKNIGLNARTVQGVELWSLETSGYDGASLDPPYEPPSPMKHDLVPGDGEKIYTGSCHCGAVKVAVQSKPLPEMKVHECNCSICSRNANTLFYPHPTHVRVSDPSALTHYSWGAKYLSHDFCSTCGVPMYAALLPKGLELLEGLEGEERQKMEKKITCTSVRVHVLDGVEWEGEKKIEVEKYDGKKQGMEYKVD